MTRKAAGTSKYAHPPRARSKTRSNKPKLIDGSDPLHEEKLLKAQLASSGLYLANTLGDGNCLFRALSDQLTGNEASHALIRHKVCEYLEQNADRYSPYVDSDAVPGGFKGHVASMRQLGTYGTDIELTAFSHLFGRSIKVFQPGLVYVIQAEDAPATRRGSPSSSSTSPASSIASTSQETLDMDQDLSPRERRLLDRKAKAKAAVNTSNPEDKGKAKCAPTEERRRRAIGSLYIAYHSWEHYSSVRRISGPHTGPPNIDQVSESGSIRAEVSDASPDPSAPREPTPPRTTRVRARLQEKKQDKRDRAATLTQQSLTNQQRHLAASVALPPSTDVSPAESSASPFESDLVINPKHRGRSMSMSSSTSTQHARQRSRRQSPASGESTAYSPASSFDLENKYESNESGTDSHLVDKDIEGDTEDTCSSADPIDLISSSNHVPRTKLSLTATTTKRGPTAREKKDLKRKKRLEMRRQKGNQALAIEAGKENRVSPGKTARAKEGDRLHLGVKELFI
ncbi:hypothetical protein OIV83_004721 [Microbotryomycetes sp. JL201]|nr:hypothetical protein OIV83_004721 [Microbotryomycetes sp. JL201]